VAGSCPDFRRASEKKKEKRRASELSGLAAGGGSWKVLVAAMG